MNELDIFNAANMMVEEGDLLDEYLLVDSFDSIRLALDSEMVFPTRLNRFATLSSGSRYLVCYYLKYRAEDPIFCDYENHLLVDSEEGTSVVSLLKSNESNEIGVLNLQPPAVASFRKADHGWRSSTQDLLCVNDVRLLYNTETAFENAVRSRGGFSNGADSS